MNNEEENNAELSHWYVVYTYSGYENKEQYEIVKKRVIGRKDNIIYMIVSADAEKLVEHIK